MIKNTIEYILLVSMVFATAFQFSSWGLTEDRYILMRNIITTIIIIIFIVSYKDSGRLIRKIPVFRTHFFGLLIFALALITLFSIGMKVNFNPLRDLALAFIILMIGINVNLTKKQFNRIINIYILLYTIAAISVVYTSDFGFVIQEQYFLVPKNQIAPAFGVAFILSFFFGFKQKGIVKWYYYILFSLLLASLLILRGRAVILAVFLTTFVFVIFYIRKRTYQVFTIIISLALLPFIGQYIYDALFLNYDITDINSISTGRVVSYTEGLDFFLDHPIFGQLDNVSYIGGTIHNYLLFNLVNYGVLLSSILFIVYFKYIFRIIKGIYKNSFQYYEVAPLVMLIIIVVSLLEYTYPYAPGSAIYFPFFLMGQYLKTTDIV